MGRHWSVTFLFLLLLIAGCNSNRTVIPPLDPDKPVPPPSECPTGNPLLGVDDAERYEVWHMCVTLTGTVLAMEDQQAGGFRLRVQPDISFRSLLKDKNGPDELFATILPNGQETATKPTQRSHIEITGAHVINKQTGQAEILPVWHITPLAASAPLPPPKQP